MATCCRKTKNKQVFQLYSAKVKCRPSVGGKTASNTLRFNIKDVLKRKLEKIPWWSSHGRGTAGVWKPISYTSSGISHTALWVRHPVGFLLGAAIQGWAFLAEHLASSGSERRLVGGQGVCVWEDSPLPAEWALPQHHQRFLSWVRLQNVNGFFWLPKYGNAVVSMIGKWWIAVRVLLHVQFILNPFSRVNNKSKKLIK